VGSYFSSSDFPDETFCVLKEKEFGEYRTRRLVLEAWDRLCERPVYLGFNCAFKELCKRITDAWHQCLAPMSPGEIAAYVVETFIGSSTVVSVGLA